MFNLSDRVQHKTTGKSGVVIGYGHQMVNSFYLTTIKVRLSNATVTEAIVEDLYNHWHIWQDGQPPEVYSLNTFDCLQVA